jgi:hypothetical protein
MSAPLAQNGARLSRDFKGGCFLRAGDWKTRRQRAGVASDMSRGAARRSPRAVASSHLPRVCLDHADAGLHVVHDDIQWFPHLEDVQI